MNRKLSSTLRQHSAMAKNVSKQKSNLERGCNLTALKKKLKNVGFTFSGLKIFHSEFSVCSWEISGERLRKEETMRRGKNK